MIKYLSFIALILLTACSSPAGKQQQQSDAATQDQAEIKVPVYAWLGGPGKATDEEIRDNFTDLKNKGIIEGRRDGVEVFYQVTSEESRKIVEALMSGMTSCKI